MTTTMTTSPKRRRVKPILWLIGAFMLAAIAWSAWSIATNKESGPRGGLKIDAPPAAEVYVGDKFVGTGSVRIAWNELLAAPPNNFEGVQSLCCRKACR